MATNMGRGHARNDGRGEDIHLDKTPPHGTFVCMWMWSRGKSSTGTE